MLLESLSCQLSGLQNQAGAAEDHIRELEAALAERDRFRKMLNTTEQEMTCARCHAAAAAGGVPGAAGYQAGPDMEISAVYALDAGGREGET